MFLSRTDSPPSGLRALAGLALDFALLRDEPPARERGPAVHPHRRPLARRSRYRQGGVAPQPQVCMCPRTADARMR